jgi:uncharacterized repeat protein (TIGR01451 family)
VVGGKSPVNGQLGHEQIEFTSILGVDVDHDGVSDAVVLVVCPVGDPALDQVVAFGRTATGTIRTLGQVVGPVNGGINRVINLAGKPDGSVSAEVTEVHGSAGTAVMSQVFQWRSYSWTGQRFVQTEGSTSFNADTTITKLTMVPAQVVFAKPQGGLRRATLTVTVTNTGNTSAAGVSVRPLLDGGIVIVANGMCAGTSPDVLCTTPEIAPGATWKVTINLTVATAVADGVRDNSAQNTTDNVVQLRLGDQIYGNVKTVAVSFA